MNVKRRDIIKAAILAPFAFLVRPAKANEVDRQEIPGLGFDKSINVDDRSVIVFKYQPGQSPNTRQIAEFTRNFQAKFPGVGILAIPNGMEVQSVDIVHDINGNIDIDASAKAID